MPGRRPPRAATTAQAPAARPDLGQAAAGHAEELAQLVGPRAVGRCRRAASGRRWWRRWRSTPPPGPPVSCHSTHESTVARARSPGRRPVSARRPPRPAATTSWWPRSRGRAPARCGPATSGRCPRSASSAHRAAVRRSCHTMARCSGSPVRRSQATTVSRWLVMPMARAAGAPSRRLATSARVTRTRAQISRASCSTQPGRGKCCRSARGRRGRRPPHRRRPPGPAPRWCRRRWPPRAPRTPPCGPHASEHGRRPPHRPDRGRRGAGPAAPPGANHREHPATRGDVGRQPLTGA